MNKLDKAKVDKLIHTLGLKYNLTDKEIKEITSSPYQFTQKTIKKLDFSEIKEEEDKKIKEEMEKSYGGTE